MKKKRAVFVGRFQPFHLGHLYAIKKTMKKFDITIVIGSTNKKRSFKNPFSFKERKEMILKTIGKKVRIIGISDVKNDKEWAKLLKKKARSDVIISGSAWIKNCFKNFRVPIIKPELFKPKILKGTKIRERIVKGKRWENLVPEEIVTYMKKIKGIERIKTLGDRI